MLEKHHSGRYVDLKHSLTPDKVYSVFTEKRCFGLVLRPSSDKMQENLSELCLCRWDRVSLFTTVFTIV